MAKKRPGVMLYFDWLPALRSLTCEEQGQLLMAVLTYAQTGEIPRFHDRTMAFAWAAIQPHIDADEQRYAEVVEKRRDAVSHRWEKEKAATPASEQRSADPPHAKAPSAPPSQLSRDLRYSAAMDKYLDF